MALTREQFIQAVMEYSRAMFRAAGPSWTAMPTRRTRWTRRCGGGVLWRMVYPSKPGRNGRGGALAVQLMQRAAGDVPPPLFFRPPLAIRAFFLYNITD